MLSRHHTAKKDNNFKYLKNY